MAIVTNDPDDAALAEVVACANGRYDENEQSRQILKQGVVAVTRWTDSEGLTPADFDLGLQPCFA